MNGTPRPDVPGHRLERVIGVGASGTVWAARDAMGREVAVKVAHEAAWSGDEEAERACRTEQHVLLAVRHEHLVALRDVVPLDDGRVALVFDLVTGAPLGSTVHARGHLRPGEVVTVVTPLCEAVATLHAAGGLHGDISPSNVMVTAEGKPLLLDLGAARLAGGPRDAPVHGTSGFVAPEVREGLVPGEASDVFALGALAWFCVTGNGAPDTMLRLDPETVLSHVGPELAALVGACIDPDPARRPPSAGLARLFYDAAAPEPVEVVVGADEASALTHRLRAGARDDATVGSGGGRPPRGGERGPSSPRVESWWRWWQGVRPGIAARPGSRASLVGTALALVVLLLAALGFAVSARSDAATPTARPAGPSTAAENRTGGSPAAAPSALAPTTSGAQPTVDELVRRGDAPSAAPQDLLQALSDRRAAALTSADVGGLDLVDGPASPALAVDTALLAELGRAGQRWEGLRLQVAQADLVTASSTRAVLRARVDWTAYAVVTAVGRQPRPAATGEVLDFTLARGARGWRVVAISPPAT